MTQVLRSCSVGNDEGVFMMLRNVHRWAAACLVLGACSANMPAQDGGGGADGGDPDMISAAAFFQTSAVHRIEITLPAAEWQRFMAEHADLNATPTLHEADFVIDGTPLRRVAFKTFGYGSREGSPRKPNLNLDLDKNITDQSYAGLTRLRIKNNGQDVTGLRQPITYEAMRSVGLWAPRTSYATLTVNSEPYGIYALEESFNKAFVRERSGDDTGAAYEAEDCQGFVPPAMGGCKILPDFYSRPFNDMVGTGDELAGICTVLSGAAAQAVAGLAPYIEVADWARAIAADLALAGDYDGFSTNGSNFRMYHDNKIGKLRLIIYGPDTTYDPDYVPYPDPLVPKPEPSCPMTNAAYHDVFLAKLTGSATGLEIYRKEVRALRQGAMSPAMIKQRADALWAVIRDRVITDPRRSMVVDPEGAKNGIGAYMDKRIAQLVAAGL